MLKDKIYKPIEDDLAQVEKSLHGLINSGSDFISESVSKIFRAGGKRIRPALLLLSSRICNYTGERAVTLAAIIECIHTASLIHDDIIDHDAIRRGSPTLHSQVGESLSVIVGDYLYSKVFEVLAIDGDLDIIRCIAATTSQMAMGDLKQLRNKFNTELSEEHYLAINADKTASLLSCSCKIGALIGEQSNGEVAILTQYGKNLGMAFQIVDDLLDLTADQRQLGKPLGSDIREGKLTLPLISTMRVADRQDRQWIEQTLSAQSLDTSSLLKMKEMVTAYQGIEYCKEKAQYYGQACKAGLKKLDQSENRHSLELFTDYVINRAC